MARLRLALLVASALLAAALVAMIAVAGGRTGTAPGWAGAQQPGIPAPEPAGLVDQEGRAVRLADLRGRPAVVTFLYTTCEDTCPLTAQQIRGALDDLGRDLPVIAIAVDPPRDTQRRARRFLAEQRLVGRMRFLTGPRAALARQWRAYGIQPQGDGLEHTAHTFLLDARGRRRIGFPTSQLTADALVHDLRLLEAESG